MRIRERSDSFKFAIRNVYPVEGWDFPTLPIYDSLPRTYERMYDVVGNRDSYNPVYQVKIHSSCDWKLDPSVTDWTGHPVISDFHLLKDLLFADHEAGLRELTPEISEAYLKDMGAKAFTAFHDQIPQDTLVANFLYELRDIKGMIPKVTRHLSTTVSSNFLAFEFGIKPFIGDVQKLLAITEKVNKRLQYLKATLGKTVDLRLKVDAPNGGPTSWTKNTFPGMFAGGNNVVFELRGYSGKLNFSAQLVHNLEGLSDLLSVPKALAAALGLNNPAAIVWEAIPYSFVVDWIFNLSGQLSHLAVQPFGGDWHLSKVGYSSKRMWVYEVYQDYSQLHPNNMKISLGTMTIWQYGRTPGLPVSSIFVTDLTLTPKQQLLSAALLNQRR